MSETEFAGLDIGPEQWKPIPGYEGAYSVSSEGRVRSEARTIQRVGCGPLTVRERIRKTSPNRGGYPFFRARHVRTGHIGNVYVHQAVLAAFSGPPPEGAIVRHLDGNPRNNRLDNLQYGTPSENNYDRVAHGNHKYANQSQCIRGHKYEADSFYVNAKNERICRVCARKHSREWYRRKNGLDPATGRKVQDCE